MECLPPTSFTTASRTRLEEWVHGENDLAAHIVLKHKVESFQENQEAQRENKEKDPNKREVPPLKDFEVHEDPDHATVQVDQDKVVQDKADLVRNDQDKADLESREEAHVRTDHERTDHESREDQKVMCPTKETLSVENRSEDLQKMRKNLKQSQRLSGYLKTI
jgi:hypothetical protein